MNILEDLKNHPSYIENRPLLIDLFSGAGGCAMGYYRVGFNVIGCDTKKQPRYPFLFYQYDAFEFLELAKDIADIIHASPPCQGYSTTKNLSGKTYPMLIPQTKDLLVNIGKPYVIENVPGSEKEMDHPIMLCGTMFNLDVIRHRYFDMWTSIEVDMECNHVKKTAPRGEYDRGQRGYITIAGNNFENKFAKKAMQIDWMSKKELAQAIPPIYTQWIGERIIHLFERV